MNIYEQLSNSESQQIKEKVKIKKQGVFSSMQETDYNSISQSMLKKQIQSFRKQIKQINVEINTLFKDLQGVKQTNISHITKGESIQSLLIKKITNNKKILYLQHNQYAQIVKLIQFIKLCPHLQNTQVLKQQNEQEDIQIFCQTKKIDQQKQQIQMSAMQKKCIIYEYKNFEQIYENIYLQIANIKIKISQYEKDVLKLKKLCQVNEKKLSEDKNITMMNYQNLIRKINEKQQSLLKMNAQQIQKLQQVQKLKQKITLVNKKLENIDNQGQNFQLDLKSWQLNKKMYLQLKKRKQKLFKNIGIKKRDLDIKIQNLIKCNRQIKLNAQVQSEATKSCQLKNSNQQQQINKLLVKYENIMSQIPQTIIKQQNIDIYKADTNDKININPKNANQYVNLNKNKSLPTDLKKMDKASNLIIKDIVSLNKKNISSQVQNSFQLSKLTFKSKNSILQQKNQKEMTKSRMYKIRLFNKQHQSSNRQQKSIKKRQIFNEDEEQLTKKYSTNKNKQDSIFLNRQKNSQVKKLNKQIQKKISFNQNRQFSFGLNVDQSKITPQILQQQQTNCKSQRKQIIYKKLIKANNAVESNKKQIQFSRTNKYLSQQYMNILQQKGRLILGLDE